MTQNHFSTSSSSSMSSGVIEMRQLAQRSTAESGRVSVPTMDLVLSVVSPSAPLAGPMQIEVPRRERSVAVPWRSIALGAGALAIAMALWGGVAPSREAPVPAPVARTEEAPVIAPVSQEPVTEPTVVADVTPTEVETPTPSAVTPRRTTRTRTSTTTSSTTTPPVASNVGDRTLEDLMHRASDAPAVVPASTSTPAPSNVATTPTRDQVRSALNAVAPAVEACADGRHGLATVSVVFTGATGAVRSATVTGPYAGTPEGSCIARAVREAQVPTFSQGTFTVSYPFAT